MNEADIKAIKTLLKRHLTGMLTNIQGDVDEYAQKVATALALYTKYRIEENPKALSTMRHIKALASSLAFITTKREANRLEETWKEALSLIAKIAVVLIKAAL